MKPKVKQLVILTFAALMLLPGAFATKAEAQGRFIRRPRYIFVRPYNPFWYRRYDPFYDPFWDPFYSTRVRTVDPIAYQREQGYKDGRDEGKDDAKKGRSADPTAARDYIKSKSLAYREAFVKGYNDRFREETRKIDKEMKENDEDN